MNAHEGSSKWVRLSFLAVAVIAAVTLALPATALAKTVTRLLVTKTVTVDNGDPNATAWPYALTVRLQKRVSGSHYHAASGTVKVYKWDVEDGAYYFVMSRKGSTISFPMPARGKYKFVFSGSSTLKPSTTYSTLMEDIGFVLTSTGVSVASVDGTTTQTWVTLGYTADWNVNAWDWRVWFGADMDFGNTEAVRLYYESWLRAPGAVEFTFKVNNVDILPVLYDNAWAYVATRDDPYIVDSPPLSTPHSMTD